jgi:3-ketosteroid 9alpha-monooxygenase subunit A
MTDTGRDETGTIPPPTRFARGWHCLGIADRFRDRKPHAVLAFDTKLVVFAGRNGRISVLDGYCRHLGGDLTQGSVKGNNIACPFHDWRWSGTGKCVEIPYAKRVRPRARTRSWLTMEQNRQLFVWHDPEGGTPAEHLAIPRIEGTFNGEWSNWTWDSVLIEGANCRQVIDNVVDLAHFFHVHFAFPTYVKNVFDGQIATQYLRSCGRPDQVAAADHTGERNTVRSAASYYGPSYLINRLWHSHRGVDIETVLVNCHYPVSANSFVLQWGVIVKKLPGVDDEQANRIAGRFAKGVGVGFRQDVQAWQHKACVDSPLCDEEGPVRQLRRWYEQFYVDAAEVTDEMTARFEFEVDTKGATEIRQHAVDENPARQRRAEDT